jgi:nucleotidyltransferase/DNA polymerase involved in DNA repair
MDCSVITACYEAKALGIKVGVRKTEAVDWRVTVKQRQMKQKLV